MTNKENIYQTILAPMPKLTLRRGFKRQEAAEYIGVSSTKFDEMILDGRMPKPKQIDARRVWDLTELDDYFSRLPGGSGDDLDVNDNPWDSLCA